MESIEVNIATFINPHCFFIIEADSIHRNTFLGNLSTRIKKSFLGSQNDSVSVDEIGAVYHNSELARAKIVKKSYVEETNKTFYSCWLVDYATLIHTEKVFKIPKEIQKITPRAKQACLFNFCYLKEHLELGVTGKIKTVPSVNPSSGVTQCCLDVLLPNYSKLVFKVIERDENILIGDILIYKKNRNELSLTKELCDRGLIAIDEPIFQRIKFSAKDYVKMNLEAIHQVCKTQQIASPVVSDSDVKLEPVKPKGISLFDETEEIDIDNLQALENGRRRRGNRDKLLNSSQTSGSDDDQGNKQTQNKTARLLEKLKKTKVEKILSEKENTSKPVKDSDSENKSTSVLVLNDSTVKPQKSESPESVKSEGPVLSKAARAVQIIKERKALEEAKNASDEKRDTKSINNECVKSPEDPWKKLAELRLRKQRTSSCSTRSEGLDSSYESNVEENESDNQKPDSSMSNEVKSTSSAVVSNTSESETKKSPFGDITSQRKTKPLGLFLPAGMEGRYNKEQQVESSKRGAKAKPAKMKPTLQKIPSVSTPDDDCPTIKIPKPSGNLTDDQISAEESKDKSEKEKDEESSDLTQGPEVFTKQDFCRMVSGCTCVKCRVVLEDDDWDTPIKFGNSEGEPKKKSKSAGPVIRPPKLLRKEIENETFVQENDILSIDYSSMSTMEKKMSCKVLVHGESIPNPINRVTQVQIHRDIYNNISRLNYKEAKRIQHYSFPAITRNQHVFMINDTGSGKTMAYLPILISFVMEKDERYSQLLKLGGGPIVVILCSNSKKCEEIYDLTKLILDRQRCRLSLVTYPRHGNISNIDILITMPTILTSLIASRATNFKRLCHFVLEDGDALLKSHYELVKKFLDYGNQVLEHRHCPKSIQIILCAEHWTPQIENILKKLNKVPLVCIGNHLEAALYGKINFTMKFLDTGCKEQNLQRILHDVYKFTRTIIICNPDEVEDITNFLPLKGIEFTAIGEESEEDTAYKEVTWSNAVPGKYSVLICTDDIYNTMNVTNAQLLVHYSLPRSWTQFIRRFSCLLEHNPTPLNIKQRKDKVSTFVFIDENCEPRMSKFCNFIKIAGVEKDLPEKIKEFFRDIASEEEHKRITRKIELCEAVKIFGKCELLHCKKRHVLDLDLDQSDSLPKNGSINFKIAKMTNTTTCSIKLLEHFDLKGQSVQKFEDFTDDISEILAKKDNYHHVSKAIENHLYLHKDGDTYWRCKLLELDESALVYLMDRGIYCKSDLNRLYRMPEDLKKIPQQCYEVHFANLIPPHEDTKFSRSAKHKAQFLVDSNCPNSVMTAQILLQLGNNLWLDDVCELREMYDKSLPSIGYQLGRELVKQELAVKSEKPLANLYNLAQTVGIALPEYKTEKPKMKRVVVKQVEPQWAFLEMDGINEVQFSNGISPGEFYVQLQKFNKQLIQLEEDIQKEILKPFYPLPQKIEVGKCYLVKDAVSGNYARGLVLKLNGDEALVFCVDYGDDVEVPASTLKHITNDLILKLPFQSIQCSMYGIKPIEDSWCDEATDLLYKMGFVDDSHFFRTLLVKTCSKEKNELISKQHSYSVIVKDGFNERHMLLNELLIDCGFAVSNGEEIKDFEVPEKKEEDGDEEEIEEIIRNQEDNRVEEEDDIPLAYHINADAFDVEIYEPEGFMRAMNFPLRKIEDNVGRNTRNDDLPPMIAAPSVDYFTPDVLWSQTDSSIKLTIKITDVKEPKVALKHNRIFRFDTVSNGKKYHLNLFFHDNVEKTFQYTTLGPEVRVRLTKCKNAEWPRLLHATKKMKNIRFDFSTIKDDEKPRKMLQLDISDFSSEDDENDGLVYHVYSDLDSEYDYDIPNDEE